MPTELPHRLLEDRIVAVLRANDLGHVETVCGILVEEGIRSIELTLTSPGALDRLASLTATFGAVADFGMGTVLDATQAHRSVEAGARFLVTPAVRPAVLEAGAGVAVYCGALTPTEVSVAMEAGASAVKIFPAETVGPEYLQHLRGPFPEIRAVPSGGVGLDTAREWIAAGAVAVSVGGPLLGDALSGGDRDSLRLRCRRLVAAVTGS